MSGQALLCGLEQGSGGRQGLDGTGVGLEDVGGSEGGMAACRKGGPAAWRRARLGAASHHAKNAAGTHADSPPL